MNTEREIKKLEKQIELEKLQDRRSERQQAKEQYLNSNLPWLSITTGLLFLFFQPFGIIYNIIWMIAYSILKSEMIYNPKQIKMTRIFHLWMVIIPVTLAIISMIYIYYYGVRLNSEIMKILNGLSDYERFLQ